MGFIQKQFYFFWKKASERRLRGHYSIYFKEALERYMQCPDKKTSGQIKKEMCHLKKYWGCFPYQYYRYDMYRKDSPLSMEEMKKYIPLYFAFYLFYPRIYKKYGILCNDKALTAALLDNYRLGQPLFLFMYERKMFFDKNNGKTDEKYFEEVIRTIAGVKVFVKPCFGVGGKGIIVFNRQQDGSYKDDDGNYFHPDFFYQHCNDQKYVVQAGVEQGEEMNQIYAGSVNTFRIFTEYEPGNIRILLSMLRIGQGGKHVDNYSSGGVTIKVDAKTGILNDFAYGVQREHVYEHPDTRFKFKGYQLQCWSEIITFVTKCAEKFRAIRILGWDIAYSVNGPVVIEINEGPSVEAIQDCYGGIRDVLAIGNPALYWKSDEFVLAEK